ncbi:hypothetical protein J2X47_002287 [Sphingomonas sp. BE270]|jgi:hypothetical protein|uniref:Uncharacterized protein n=1 Tax=Sphingobium yanoikuyae TaxID=13690 RepID=A0A9X7UCH3_SPHYA|nr:MULTISPECIES: hypothetical protein [Alphaproteobacteria]MBY0143654.1 hypothetical protein [Methylorubrum populi]MCH4021874.1 hypothetical protein [Acetobacter sp.]MBK3406137.1 hypothetical protein [Methylorubrum rhodesianum]MCH4061511.1 hypothetical protein [Acetobacter sp.]MDR7258101.1 hypothetical protein [Sphingomonas sp. BE270]
MTIQPSLKKYLICYGADNEFWLCDAESRDHAVEQFENTDMDDDINHVFECVPALNRYFVRQRRAMWVCLVQEVEAEDEEAAIDTFYNEFAPEYSVIEDAVSRVEHGPATVFDRSDYPTAQDVAEDD